VLILRREECASSSEWKKGNRNELEVPSNVTAAQEEHSKNRREWRSANAGDDGDMCEVMNRLWTREFDEVVCTSLLGNPLAPILKPPIVARDDVHPSTESNAFEGKFKKIGSGSNLVSASYGSGGSAKTLYASTYSHATSRVAPLPQARNFLFISLTQ
jgi:hypothetical protein